MDNIWNICDAIRVIFELFGLGLIWIGLIGVAIHDEKPRWFNVIFDLFFGVEDGDF